MAGIVSPLSDGSDVRAVSRSPSGRFVATGDDHCRINLFDYPVEAPEGHSAVAHASGVTGVAWSGDDRWLFSAAGDAAVLQWRARPA